MSTTHTEALARLGLEPKSEDLSAEAFGAARMLLLDTLGCALAGHREPGIRAVVEQMSEWGGKPEASVLNGGTKLPMPNAAFANSAMIHALDFDDIHMPSSLHITSVVVPIVLAEAERVLASGRDALAAMIMGIEVACRLGMAERSRRRHGGFLPTSLAGGFGGVVASARLRGLSESQCVNAMGTYYAQAAGNRQALLDMTLTKRVQPGFAARSALWATALAERGITGPAHALEGRYGYFELYMKGEACELDSLIVKRKRYEVERVSIKHYPSCGGCHSVQVAAEYLAREEHLAPDEIGHVQIFGCQKNGLVGGAFDPGPNPQVDAQFSARWAVAYALLRGTVKIENYSNEKVAADREVATLANAIEFVSPPEDLPPSLPTPPDYPAHSTHYQGVIVHTRTGVRFMRTQCPAQTFAPERDNLESVLGKFRDCASYSGNCSPDLSESLIQEICRLDRAADLSALGALLTASND